MKRTALYAIVIIVTYAFSSPAFGCNVCHSKNPKMVRMHAALQFKDCFTCHRPGSMRSGPELKDQMTTDQRCVSCHRR